MDAFKPRTLEVKGKTIDEAIFKGIQQMDLSIDQVTIETIQEGTKGILGFGAKPCIIRLTEREPDYVLMNHDLDDHETSVVLNESEKKSKPEPKETRAPIHKPVMRNDFSNQERTNKNLRRTQKSALTERDPSSRRDENINYVLYEPDSAGCDGSEFLYQLLQHMGVEAKLYYFEGKNSIRFKIECDSMGILIGYRGETLDSMQYLTSLIVNRKQEEYRRVILDTENYRNKREETLIRLAKKVASQVKSTGKEVALEPMNPYERRILHSALQRNPYVQTSSKGEEPNRYIVVSPKRK